MKKQNELLVFKSLGQPKNILLIKHKEAPDLMSDDLLVEMRFAPINPSELIPIQGNYAHRIPLPSVQGYEGVGVVGEGVDHS